jgi:hypothetical protein
MPERSEEKAGDEAADGLTRVVTQTTKKPVVEQKPVLSPKIAPAPSK